jgi:hypothetical protein
MYLLELMKLLQLSFGLNYLLLAMIDASNAITPITESLLLNALDSSPSLYVSPRALFLQYPELPLSHG